MFKKRKIREEFDKIFQTGNEQQIKEMLKNHPWLLEERTEKFNVKLNDQRKVLASLGIMEDDLGTYVPISKIQNSLQIDLTTEKSNEEILIILEDLEKLGFVKRDVNGWTLTEEGGSVCDDFLNKQMDFLDIL